MISGGHFEIDGQSACCIYKKRGQPHRHNSKYKKGTDGNETNRTKENMQDEKQARTKRYRGDEKVRRGTRRVQSATQRHRALPSALRALTQRPQPPERPHGPDRTRSRGLPLGAGQPRSFGPGKPSTSESTTWSPHTEHGRGC